MAEGQWEKSRALLTTRKRRRQIAFGLSVPGEAQLKRKIASDSQLCMPVYANIAIARVPSTIRSKPKRAFFDSFSLKIR